MKWSLARYRQEHQLILQLLERLEHVEESARREELLALCRLGLEKHLRSEETELYSELSEREGFFDRIEKAFDDHQELRSLMEETAQGGPVRVLLQAVRQHFQEEERELFPLISQQFHDVA